MQAQKNSESKKRPKFRKKTLKWLLMLLVILILAAFFSLPWLISSQTAKKMILAKLNSSFDGQTTFSSLTVGWLKGINISDITFNDSKSQTSVTIKQFSTKPRYASLLMGNLSLGKTIIDEPKIQITLKDQLVETNVNGQQKTPTVKKTSGFVLPVKKIDLIVKNGYFKVTDSRAKTVELSQINSKLNLRGPGKETDFDIDMVVISPEKNSKITATGKIKPATKKTGWTLKGTSGEFKIKIDELDLASLGIFFALAGKDIQPTGTLNAEIDVKIDDGRFEKLVTKAIISDLKKTFEGKDVLLTEPVSIEAQISSDDKDVRIDKLNIKSSFCTISCTGGINAIEYNAAADLGGLWAFAGQFADLGDYSLSGEFVSDGTVSFSEDKIKATGKSDLKEFVINSPNKTPTLSLSAGIGFDIEIQTDKNIVRINSAKAISKVPQTLGHIEIKNSIVPLSVENKDALDISLTADLDLQKLQSLIDSFKPLPNQTQIAGRLKSNISVKAERKGYHIFSDDTQIQNLKISQPGQKPFEDKQVKLIVDMICDPTEKTIQINDLQLESSSINITQGKLTQSHKKGQTTLTGQLQAEYDWAAVSDLISPFLPQELTIQGKRNDTISFTSRYPRGQTEKIVANLNMNARLGFEKAQYMGLDFGRTDLDIQIQEGLLTIAPFSTTVNNGKFNFAGSADFKDTPVLFKIPAPVQLIEDIDINDKTTKKLLMYLNPIFADVVNVHGTANFHCEKLTIPLTKANRDDIEVIGTVSMDNLRLSPSGLFSQILSAIGANAGDKNIRIHPTRFVLQNGFLRYDNMQMDIGDNPINFRGVIGLDKSLDMTITLPYTLKGRTARVDRDTMGQRIELPLTGTVDKPELDISRLFEDQLKKQLERELRKQLKKLFK